MYLKRIEIVGFKSFADRTVIDFENGVTAIVGPNGSGKSNITEAIRWVLGEQSAKSLRGGKMPDVIFAGSQGRKALNIAEVTMVLDNKDQYLALDFTEVSVTRRLRRTGESEFFINKQACRLKDIQDLFMDSGLGKESFSIISQGKVEAIFNSKPEERRGIFEEAAGVLKYKQRKKKAEQKLVETEDNLSRVQDIIYELEDQLAPLKTQSDAAQQFLQLKERLTKVDVGVTVAQIIEGKANWAQQSELFAAAKAKLQQVQQALKQTEQQVMQFQQKQQVLDAQIEQEQQQLLRVTEGLKQTEGQKNVLKERAQHTLETTAAQKETLEALTGRIENVQDTLQQLAQKIQQNTTQQTRLAEQLKQAENDVATYSKSSKELLDELRHQAVAVMQDQVQVKNELTYLDKQYQKESGKNQQLIQKYEQLEAQLSKAKIQEAALAEQVQMQAQQLEVQREEFVSAKQMLAEQKQTLETSQKQMYQMMNQVQQLQAKQKSLQEIQENYAGFYQGVRTVLTHKAQLSGVIGAVAELIEVPSPYTQAIETALGQAAQHIVVETEANGQQAIAFLKQRRAGRATFLPRSVIRSRRLSQALYEKVQHAKGFVGVASELIQYDASLAAIMENLFGQTLVADTLADASDLARLVRFQCRIVTLEGDVINAGGAMTGGATKQRGGLFSQNQELKELTEKSAHAQQKLATCEQTVAKWREKVNAQTQHLEQLREAGEACRLQQQTLLNQSKNQTDLRVRLEKEQQVFTYETRELQVFLSEYAQKKEALQENQAALALQKATLDEKMAQVDQEASQMEAKKAQALARYTQLQSEQAVILAQSTHLLAQQTEKQQQLDEILAQQTALQTQLQELQAHSSDQQLTEEGVQEQLQQFAEKQVQLQETLRINKEKRQNVQQQLAQCNARFANENKQQQQLLTQQTELEVQKNRYELQLDNALQYLQEEYQLTFERAQTQFPLEMAPAAGQAEAKRLKKAIAALGPVNLNAIEQYQQVETRYQFLTTQREDLLQAKAQLFETMEEMDQEVTQRFLSVFEAIRCQFKTVFPSMFGGGQAELLLTDPTDLLHTGIEIQAQPPGKKLQNLSLLSGGERALTAISLLFSIIRVRPVPFCVLDEVEAALDDANVARFGRYLSEYEKETQFIVVTHRKGTMAAATVLYGVTMQQSGISTIVSVRLEEVKENGALALSGGTRA